MLDVLSYSQDTINELFSSSASCVTAEDSHLHTQHMQMSVPLWALGDGKLCAHKWR